MSYMRNSYGCFDDPACSEDSVGPHSFGALACICCVTLLFVRVCGCLLEHRICFALGSAGRTGDEHN